MMTMRISPVETAILESLGIGDGKSNSWPGPVAHAFAARRTGPKRHRRPSGLRRGSYRNGKWRRRGR